MYLEAERSAEDLKLQLCTKVAHQTLCQAGVEEHVASEKEERGAVMFKISGEIGAVLASIKVGSERPHG